MGEIRYQEWAETVRRLLDEGHVVEAVEGAKRLATWFPTVATQQLLIAALQALGTEEAGLDVLAAQATLRRLVAHRRALGVASPGAQRPATGRGHDLWVDRLRVVA